MIFKKKKKIWFLCLGMIILFDVCLGHMLTRQETAPGYTRKEEEAQIRKELIYFPIPLSLDPRIQ